jgi:hypothetical protein
MELYGTRRFLDRNVNHQRARTHKNFPYKTALFLLLTLLSTYYAMHGSTQVDESSRDTNHPNSLEYNERVKPLDREFKYSKTGKGKGGGQKSSLRQQLDNFYEMFKNKRPDMKTLVAKYKSSQPFKKMVQDFWATVSFFNIGATMR